TVSGDRLDHFVGYLRRRHFRLLVVSRDLWRWHENPLLAGKDHLAAAVEEKCDMCVFFGLGDTQLGQPSPGNHLAEGIREILRREQRAEKAIEPGRVLDEPERCGKRDWLSPWEVLEIRIEQGSSDFAHSIGAKVCDQHPVAVFHPA